MKYVIKTIPNTRHIISATVDTILTHGINDTYVIVVPDKLSFTMESNLLTALDLGCTFNIDITTLNRLCSALLTHEQRKCILQSEGTQLLTYMSLLAVKDELKIFNKNCHSPSFAKELTSVISQFKSSGISEAGIMTHRSENVVLDAKMTDIAIILTKYTQLKSHHIDANDILTIGCLNLHKTPNIGNTHYIFCGYDDMTAQGYEIVKRCAKLAKTTTVISYDSDKANRHMYNKTHLDKLYLLAVQNDIPCAKISFSCADDDLHDFLSQNLFATNKHNTELTPEYHYSTYSARTLDEELDYVFKRIRQLVIGGERYNDICVAACGLDTISGRMSYYIAKYGLDCYIDTPTRLSDTSYSKYTESLIHFAYDPNKEVILSLIANEYCPLSDKCKSTLVSGLMTKEYVSLKTLKEIADDLYPDITEWLGGLMTPMLSSYQILQNVTAILHSQQTVDNNDRLREYHMDQRTYYQIKIIDQVISAVDSIFSQLLSLTEDVEMGQFIEFYRVISMQKHIKSLPISLDNILICEAESLFEVKKILFIINCDASTAPKTVKDTAIISDKDIDALKLNQALAPTVRHINKLCKFRLFNISLLFGRRLYITYHGAVDSASILSRDIDARLSLSGKEGSLTHTITKDTIARMSRAGLYEISLPCSKTECLEISRRHDKDVLTRACAQLYPTSFVDDLGLSSTPNMDKISATQLETYFDCPFKHFVRYRLRLREVDTEELNAMDVGNILHIVAHKYYHSELPPGELVRASIDEYLISLHRTLTDTNAALLKNICSEGERFIHFLKYFDTYSDYVIASTEYSVQYDLLGTKLLGKVDRIDICGDYIRIIDYKTGHVGSNVIKDLYFGHKLQLLLYAAACKGDRSLGGVFYMPVHNTFASSEQTDMYKLVGIFDKSPSNANAMDTRLSNGALSSDLFPISLRASSTSQQYVYSNYTAPMTSTQLDRLMQYSLDVSKQAIDEMSANNISPSPINIGGKSSCEFCQYLQLCKYVCRNIQPRAADISPSADTVYSDTKGESDD